MAAPGGADSSAGWLRRLAWFAAIWALSIGALALVSYGLKLWIAPG